MTLYRVEFSEDWIKGRWGYTDRVFHTLKGRVTEPSRLENAWLVDYTGHPAALGDVLSEMLNIKNKDYQKFGTIFEIIQLSDSETPTHRGGKGGRQARRPTSPWEVPPEQRRRTER